MTENGVTGTGDGSNAVNNDYDQVNYYANNALGAMGGYESLPDPVPATQMVYNHVGRALLGGYGGQAGSVPAAITDGTTVSYDFTYTIPAEYDQSEMHIVTVLIDNTNGSIITASETSVTEALSVEEVASIEGIKVYPNPAKDNLNISFETGSGNYNITITDMLGRTVVNNNYDNVFGSSSLEVPVSQLSEGHYILNISNGNASYNTKFIVNK